MIPARIRPESPPTLPTGKVRAHSLGKQTLTENSLLQVGQSADSADSVRFTRLCFPQVFHFELPVSAINRFSGLESRRRIGKHPHGTAQRLGLQ